MALIDTNILVYAARRQAPQHEKAGRFLKGLVEGGDTWHLTWQNVFEFIRVMTDAQATPGRPMLIDEALNALRPFLSCASLQLIHPGHRHFEIFADIAAHTPGIRGLFVHDARLAAIMIENGVREIYTADEGFRRFRDIQVVNPFV